MLIPNSYIVISILSVIDYWVQYSHSVYFTFVTYLRVFTFINDQNWKIYMYNEKQNSGKQNFVILNTTHEIQRTVTPDILSQEHLYSAVNIPYIDPACINELYGGQLF